MMEATDFWWNSLRHEGLLLDQTRLGELQAIFEGKDNAMPSSWLCEKLRLKLSQSNEQEGNQGENISLVLNTTCHFDQNFTLLKGSEVASKWSWPLPDLKENIKPNWLYLEIERPALPVFIDKDTRHRLGQGRGRGYYSKVLRWLRAFHTPLGLLTNGRQWRLIYASLDHEAYCEWDSETWFANGETTPEFCGFLQIFLPEIWKAKEGKPSRLHAAVQDSRKGQNDLSSQMGERVRQAVELLIREHGEALGERGDEVDAKSIYMAGVRMVMRLVVVFFAESREGLLPKSNAVYSQNYSLGGLIQQLKRHRGNREALAASYHAWPRLLALMKLIYTGSSHEAMPVAPYGGKLFAPGNPAGRNAVDKVIALFENEWRNQSRPVMSDAAVLDMLVMLAETRVRIRQQRQFITVPMPIDFSSLGNEYIGILFESLLNFELKRAEEDNPIVFVNVGDQPALPLNKLEQMSDKELSDMFKALKDAAKKAAAGDAAGDEENEPAEESEGTEEEAEAGEEASDNDSASESDDEDDTDDVGATRRRTLEWAARACRVTRIVRQPRTRNQATLAKYDEALAREAKRLVPIIVEPGQWYLVRWGGTRKGSGTFYTKPQLAVPTVERTLAPLAHDEQGNWRSPQEILALKVCDPACGSGSFLLASLRYLTNVLYDSILAHHRLENQNLRNIQDIISGVPSEDVLSTEQLPCRPEDDDFEPRFKAILRRHVVENCIYGVDLDAVAVELCRLALWIETLDRTLPMTFLDHKVKCGNSLVGAWSDQFLHYPLAAWTREGGDKGHDGVHFANGVWTKEIAERLKEAKAQIIDQLDNTLPFMQTMSREDALSRMEALRQTMAKLHSLKAVDVAEQAKLYETMRGSDEYQALRQSFDLWCSLWFWPGEKLDLAPMPNDFALERLSPEQMETLLTIAEDNHFFHWELEFPEVFGQERFGFDAILGNPPWDISKPKSQEYFSNVDPLFRTYGKQVAKAKQKEYFTDDQSVEEGWLHYCAGFKGMSNWIQHSSVPFGERLEDGKYEIPIGKPKENCHVRWKSRRGQNSSHPFQFQGGGDINLYKLFLEQAYSLVKTKGRIGFIVPSGIYSDKGTKKLRELFFNKCSLEWLFSFENRKKIFDIDSRFKFNPLVIQKGGHTESFRAAFMRQDINDWENAEQFAIDYPVNEIKRFSPESLSVLEISGDKDLSILSKIYEHSILLGDESKQGWGISISNEFHMTNDSHLFPPQDTWREWGYEPDEYSRWIKGPWKPVEELYELPEVRPHVHALAVVAQPPYNTLRVKRCDLPVGIILSRDCTKWLRYDEIPNVTFTEANGKKVITYKIGTGKNAHIHEIVGKAIALPLYEGCMITHYDFSYQKYLRGTGNKSEWEDVPWDHKHIYSHYLMGENVYTILGGNDSKLAFRAIGCSTNKRTLYCAPLTRQVSSHSLCVITGSNITSVYQCSSREHDKQDVSKTTSLNLLGCCLNSLVFDNCLRYRMCGTNISKFIMKECPVLSAQTLRVLNKIATGLNYCDKTFAQVSEGETRFSLTRYERLRLMVISDAVIAKLYGLNEEDYRFVLAECDYPADMLSNKKFAAGLNPKGFWRVDREVEPELRLTVLSLVAFMELEKVIAAHGGDVQAGIAAFLKQNDGEGWMLPNTLTLADYGLGHDERAKSPQAVASRLGSRFYDWQETQSPEEFKRECAIHAANLALGARDESDDEASPASDDQGKDSDVKSGPIQQKFDF